jgi:hypothetical protein
MYKLIQYWGNLYHDEVLLNRGVGAGPSDAALTATSRGSLPSGDPAKTSAVCRSWRAAATLQAAGDGDGQKGNAECNSANSEQFYFLYGMNNST